MDRGENGLGEEVVYIVFIGQNWIPVWGANPVICVEMS